MDWKTFIENFDFTLIPLMILVLMFKRPAKSNNEYMERKLEKLEKESAKLKNKIINIEKNIKEIKKILKYGNIQK